MYIQLYIILILYIHYSISLIYSEIFQDNKLPNSTVLYRLAGDVHFFRRTCFMCYLSSCYEEYKLPKISMGQNNHIILFNSIFQLNQFNIKLYRSISKINGIFQRHYLLLL